MRALVICREYERNWTAGYVLNAERKSKAASAWAAPRRMNTMSYARAAVFLQSKSQAARSLALVALLI